MAKFKKIILKTGKYYSPDGEVDVTPERMQHWVSQHKLMKTNGLLTPTPFGHLNFKPKTYEEKEYFASKYNAGYLDDLRIDNIDGEDNLVAILDIPRAEDASRVGTSLKEVSPQIEKTFTDGLNRKYTDCITHLALVTLPVIPGQSNFELLPDVPIPENANRLSLSLRIGDKKMAEETESKKECKLSKGLVEKLKKIGIELGDDVSEDNFYERLEGAASTLAEQMDKFDAEQEKPDDGGGLEDLINLEDLTPNPAEQTPVPGGPETPAPTPLKEEPQTMTMSLKNEQKLSLHSAKLAEYARERLDSDINTLLESGRITPVIANKLKEESKTYNLSLRDDGSEEPSVVKEKIETLKLLPAGASWEGSDKTRLRNAKEESLPSGFGADLSGDDAEKIANTQLKYSGKHTSL